MLICVSRKVDLRVPTVVMNPFLLAHIFIHIYKNLSFRPGYHVVGGLPLPSVLESFLKPNICPTIPPGFGTGHSLRSLLLDGISSSTVSSSSDTCSTTFGACRHADAGADSSLGTPTFLLLRRLGVPSGFRATGPSAYATRGAGQGSAWGRPTTRKEARRVVAKREEVRRERGWRCGGIVGSSSSLWCRPGGG
jgi:hypothetical protein